MKNEQPVVSYNPGTGELRLFRSTREAARAGFNRRNIWSAAKGKLRHHRGMWWRYLPREQLARLAGRRV